MFTFVKIKNYLQNGLKILIAPLDWGLGHSTRMIPIIRFLLENKCDVSLAGSGLSLDLLKKNFPKLPAYNIPAYDIHYKGNSFTTGILKQLPKFFKIIKEEQKWLDNHLKNHDYDLIISDNRYGFYSKKIKSVICTHQVQILSGKGKMADNILLRWHLKQLNKFSETWIIDNEDIDKAIVPLQSHPNLLPDNYKYIGWLSQFERKETNEVEDDFILVLLSGPEPKRSELQDAIIAQTKELPNQKFVIISGTNEVPKTEQSNLQILGLCDAITIQNYLEKAQLVIARSGYSTIMDLALFGKKALLIPTPQQTEQEYIAKRLMEQNIFYTVNQNTLELENDIAKAMQFTGFNATSDGVNCYFQKAIIN